ncbi:hypothetical protein MCOR25_009657 [Pyricularia grisea]|nr:hypothetical protein MCOR25_009657 [Pyricularia grisea]
MQPTPTTTGQQPIAGPTPSVGCTHAVPGSDGHVSPTACNSNYATEISFAPALAAAVIFCILTVTHIVLAFTTRKTYAWVLIMGGIWESAAFVIHTIGAKDQQSEPLAVGYSILYLLAPLWITAFIYMTFARQVWYWTPDQRLFMFSAHVLSKVFVLADVVAFILQFLGAALVTNHKAKTPEEIRRGAILHLTGLSLQLAVTIVFLALMAAWHLKMIAYEAERAHLDPYGDFTHKGPMRRSWKFLHAAMYIAVLLITVRLSFRLAESGQILFGNARGGLASSQILQYLLDAAPIMLCLAVLAVAHPGRFLIGKDSEMPSWSERRAAAREARDLQARKEAAFGNAPTESISDRYWGTRNEATV